jgi:hypothetical protein
VFFTYKYFKIIFFIFFLKIILTKKLNSKETRFQPRSQNIPNYTVKHGNAKSEEAPIGFLGF